MSSATQGSNPAGRNNDSRKTSGANTPSKDGANTPTTHQSQSLNRMQRGAGGPQSTTPGNHSTAEFGSAVSAGLNSHLNA